MGGDSILCDFPSDFPTFDLCFLSCGSELFGPAQLMEKLDEGEVERWWSGH